MIFIAAFKKFVDEITADNSRIYKQSVLEKYKDDESVKYFLNFVYNPFIITGISEKKLNKDVDLNHYELFLDDKMTINPDTNLTMWLDYPSDDTICEYLKKNNTGRDSDIRTVQFYRDCHINEECKSLFNAIITKNLQLGIDVKTINKVIPNLIPEFNVMLANKYFDNPSIVEGKSFAITTKIDGGRIIALKENGKVSFYTRQGQLYEGLVDLENEMLRNFPDNVCLDGELTLLDSAGLTSKEQYKKTMKISRADGEKHGLKMLVFDYMSAHDFRAQKSYLSYVARHEILTDLFKCYQAGDQPKFFKLLPILYMGADTRMIQQLLNEQVDAGEEGIMINMLDAKYEFRRTNSLLKVKLMKDLDLRVIGYEEGTNRNAGTLGAILVSYKGNTVKVGSGFSDTLRQHIWANREKYLNTIVSIQYFEETSNADGGISLRFPIFLDFRPDKTTPDF